MLINIRNLHGLAEIRDYDCTNEIKQLLSEGANISARDLDGATALHVAARIGGRRNLLALLEAGADLWIEDNAGHTPLDAAMQNGHMLCVVELLGYGANISGLLKADDVLIGSFMHGIYSLYQEFLFALHYRDFPTLHDRLSRLSLLPHDSEIKKALGFSIDSNGSNMLHILVADYLEADGIDKVNIFSCILMLLRVDSGKILCRKNKAGLTPLELAQAEKENAASLVYILEDKYISRLNGALLTWRYQGNYTMPHDSEVATIQYSPPRLDR